MAEGDVLQIVVFSVLFALAVTAIGKKAKAFVAVSYTHLTLPTSDLV